MLELLTTFGPVPQAVDAPPPSNGPWGFALLIVILAVTYYFMNRRRKRRDKDEEEERERGRDGNRDRNDF